MISVGIDLKELGGVRCRNVCNFAQRLKFKADFHSKMSVCIHELEVGGGGSTPSTPDISNPDYNSEGILIDRLIDMGQVTLYR